MNEEVSRFFKSISFSDENFNDCILDRVVLKKGENKFLVYLKNKDVLPVGSVNRLFLCAMNGINGEKSVEVNISYDNIGNNDVGSLSCSIVLRFLLNLISGSDFSPILIK